MSGSNARLFVKFVARDESYEIFLLHFLLWELLTFCYISAQIAY
jgi:hypothetical protein